MGCVTFHVNDHDDGSSTNDDYFRYTVEINREYTLIDKIFFHKHEIELYDTSFSIWHLTHDMKATNIYEYQSNFHSMWNAPMRNVVPTIFDCGHML